RYLLDGDELEFGEFKLSVIHTPGHTPGSVCFVVANHAFVGDTILAGGVGKQTPETDLRRQMMSIGTRLLRLPLSTALYPGHGPGFNPAGPTTRRLPGASQRRRGEGLARGGDHCPRRDLSGARRLEPERLAHDSERGGDVGHAVYELDTENTRVLLIALATE